MLLRFGYINSEILFFFYCPGHNWIFRFFFSLFNYRDTRDHHTYFARMMWYKQFNYTIEERKIEEKNRFFFYFFRKLRAKNSPKNQIHLMMFRFVLLSLIFNLLFVENHKPSSEHSPDSIRYKNTVTPLVKQRSRVGNN